VSIYPLENEYYQLLLLKISQTSKIIQMDYLENSAKSNMEQIAFHRMLDLNCN
jgi:hypothetical protein